MSESYTGKLESKPMNESRDIYEEQLMHCLILLVAVSIFFEQILTIGTIVSYQYVWWILCVEETKNKTNGKREQRMRK